MPTFTGTAGDDVLTGGEGDDVLLGLDGTDTLRGGRGLDRLSGGTGGDAFVFAAGDSIAGAMDAILDFQTGTDRLVLEDLRTPTELGVSVTLARTGDGGTLVFANHTSGPQTVIGVTGTIQGTDVVGGQTPVRVYMLGSDGADILIGGAGADILNGGAGDDVLFVVQVISSEAAWAQTSLFFRPGHTSLRISARGSTRST